MILFECHYCDATFKNFTGLVKHFEVAHWSKDEYIVLEFPADRGGRPIIIIEETADGL
jgi:hypothetical protein